MSLFKSAQRRQREQAARTLYGAIVEQARLPRFYEAWGVPDTLDGRFDMVVLHAWMVMRRLGGVEGGKDLAQDLFDLMFADMDHNLREIGVSDLAVGGKVKAMAKAFYGRCAAYDQGLASSPADLEAALARNLYGTVSPQAGQVTAMAEYLRCQADAVGTVAGDALLAGKVAFMPPVAPETTRQD